MYFWEETRVNILDSAPRAIQPTRSSVQCQKKLQCLYHGTSWSDRTQCMLQTLKKSTKCKIFDAKPEADIEKELKSQVCSCGKNEMRKPGLNLPKDVIEQNIWDVHTYFNNLFNAKSTTDDLATLREFLSKMLDECIIYNDTFRYVFLQRLMNFLQLQLLDLEAFVQQLVMEQKEREIAGSGKQNAFDAVLEQFEPSAVEWLEKCVTQDQ